MTGEGGGTWLIEVIFEDYSDFWSNRWEVTNQNAADRKIWKVGYGRTHTNIMTEKLVINIDATRNNISKSLTEIRDFAFQHNLQHCGDWFERALKVLDNEQPNNEYYHHDLIIAENYSLKVRQQLFCVGCAWVFGGMGSWNDISFAEKAISDEYERLSYELYENITQSVLAGINSF